MKGKLGEGEGMDWRSVGPFRESVLRLLCWVAMSMSMNGRILGEAAVVGELGDACAELHEGKCGGNHRGTKIKNPFRFSRHF